MRADLFNKDLEIPYQIVDSVYTEEGWKDLDTPVKEFQGYPIQSKMMKNFTFSSTIFFTHFTKGRSSVKAHFTDLISENRYEMFLSDLSDILKRGYDLTNLTGIFCFRKQGANFGLTKIED